MSEELSSSGSGYLSGSPANEGPIQGKGNHQSRRLNKHRAYKSRSPTRDTNDPGTEGADWRAQMVSRSPTRNGSGSRSPTRRQGQSKSPSRGVGHSHHHSHPHGRGKKVKPASLMTVIVNRSDLWDSAAHFQPDENMYHQVHHHPDAMVNPYHYEHPSRGGHRGGHSVAVARVPHVFQKDATNPNGKEGQGQDICEVIDTSIPNPHDPNVVHDKYWAQRRRLFSRFDQGIQLDSEGWYSVTPEIIADHVAHRVADIATSTAFRRESSEEGIILLDAFCGCGGNTIAFGKMPTHLISKVVCVDTDRSKLLKAAHNASLYGIPRNKLVFVECNSIFILQHCYKDGEFVLDKPMAALPPYMPNPVMPAVASGYHIGGLDMLPRRIDAVFMDPPWGGVDYEVLGKNGYDLQKNMKIQVSPEEEYHADGDGVGDDFFDTFSTPQTTCRSQKSRKANFNKKTDGHFIDGMEMLKVAAEATSSRIVVFDLPRNTNKGSLGKCAIAAGYRGNMKLEEHYLNGRLKTVTAYMGADYSALINDLHEGQSSNEFLSPQDHLITGSSELSQADAADASQMEK